MSQLMSFYPIRVTNVTCCGWKEMGNLQQYLSTGPNPAWNANSDWSVPRTQAVYDAASTERAIHDFLKAIYRMTAYGNGGDLRSLGCGAVLFNVAIRANVPSPTYGEQMKAFLEEKKFGEVRTLDTFYNPNSGNTIQPYVWIPNSVVIDYWNESKLYDQLRPENEKKKIEWQNNIESFQRTIEQYRGYIKDARPELLLKTYEQSIRNYQQTILTYEVWLRILEQEP